MHDDKVLHANGEEGISLSHGILTSTGTFAPKSLSTLVNPALHYFVDLILSYTVPLWYHEKGLKLGRTRPWRPLPAQRASPAFVYSWCKGSVLALFLPLGIMSVRLECAALKLFSAPH